VAVGALLALGVVGAVALPRLRVETDITHFLPSSEDRWLAELSTTLATSDLNRTITLVLDAPDADSAARAGRAMSERLEELEGVAWVRSGPDPELQEAFYDAYFSRRLGMIAESPEQVRALFEPEALRARMAELRGRLGSPTGTFVRRIAPEDPWMAFVTHLERLRDAQQGELSVREGQFVVGEDERAAVVLLATEASPFDGAAVRPVLDGIDAAFADVSSEVGGLTLSQSGVHRLAARSEATIRADITRVSVVGTVGVILLLLLLFRSLRYLVLAVVPLGGGMVAAVAATQLLFGGLHGLTLAFGATLIGVAIDYVAHLLSHHSLQPAVTPKATLQRIWPGLLVGCATTVAGLAGLAWTSFPGIREMAVFTSVGVATALLLTRVFLPPFLPVNPKATRLHRWLEKGATRFVRGMEGRRTLWILPVTAIVIAAFGAPIVTWDDDVRALSALDPNLLEEDEAVRARVARMDAGRLIVARGADLEEALVANDAVDALLRSEALVERHRSLAPMLPSVARQRAVREAIPADAMSRTNAALEAEGFVPTLFAPAAEALDGELEALTWETLPEPVRGIARSFRVDTEDGVVLLTFVHGTADLEALTEKVEAIDGVRLFDQSALMQSAYGGFRTRTLQLVGLGLVAVFLLVFGRYRKLGPALAAFLPAVIAAGVTLALLALLGQHANLLHLVTLLLVLSMGVDYGVFLVEGDAHERGGAASLVSVIVACASTMLSFGALAMSESPAMQAMGLTAAIGVLTSLLLAPIAWLLQRR